MEITSFSPFSFFYFMCLDQIGVSQIICRMCLVWHYYHAANG